MRNVHERVLHATPDELGLLLDALARSDDPVWPYESWPRLRLAPGLELGARGGHGPVRYDVETYEPGSSVRFRFRRPSGFHGTHGFSVVPVGAHAALRHELVMDARGAALLTWPLVYRPLHDALIEDALDKVGRRFGMAPRAHWSWWVRLLRALFRLRTKV